MLAGHVWHINGRPVDCYWIMELPDVQVEIAMHESSAILTYDVAQSHLNLDTVVDGLIVLTTL